MIKDSGKREKLPGMVRDTTDDKIDYTLALDGPLFDRLAKHLTEGAKKYSKRNWMGAHTEAEYLRFRESLVRHLIQYLRGDTDEDHFAAVAFNLNGLEYTRLGLDKAAQSAVTYCVEHRRGPSDRRKCQNDEHDELRRLWEEGRRKGDTQEYSKQPKCGDKNWLVLCAESLIRRVLYTLNNRRRL